MKQTFFNYPPVADSDADWGLYLNVAGNATINPGEEYPPPGHPNEYNFTWDKGRVLHEFQINYITNGSGVMETKAGVFEIEPGSVLLLFPGIWHRYRPNQQVGWTEHYIGFNGDFTQKLYQHPLLDPQRPVLKIGFQEQVLNEFNEIFSLISEEKPGFQQVSAGRVIYLLAKIISTIKNSEFAGKEVEMKIRKACLYMRDNLNTCLNVEKLAGELNIGYSYFRRMFKKYTGMSPAQYHLNLRIQKSKEMLLGNKSIKEIAFEMGFDSIHYFSRIYKKKEGVSPSSLRNKNC
jgi:AraC-like DNA-binding protein